MSALSNLRTLGIVAFALVMTATSFVFAEGTVDDIKYHVAYGRYREAVDEAAPLLKKSPRDANLNYWYGRALVGLGELSQGRSALETAADRGYTDAYRDLIDLSLKQYDPESAESYLDNWSDALRKARKTVPDIVSDYQNRILLMSNQLERVEDIPVIARYDVPFDTFLEAVRNLSDPNSARGTVLLPGDIPFMINNQGREAFWVAPDSLGINRLFTAGILDDGTVETPVELTEFIGDGIIGVPFMMQDGETLYFSAKRDSETLGGFDIYMTRRNDEGGFYEPSSIGMPYNSPWNDYLYVIDEENNLGWWATDRYSAPDEVSILVFVPNETRRNVDSDDSDVTDRAKVTDFEQKAPAGFDTQSALMRLRQQSATMAADDDVFALSLGNGRVITSMDDFKNDAAADAMVDVLDARDALAEMERRLDNMRDDYAKGDKSLAADIRNLENEVARRRTELQNLTNRVIRLETNAR